MPTPSGTAAVLSPLRLLLSNAGAPLIATGMLFSLWAIWNVFKPPQERWMLAQIVLSLISGVVALFAVYAAATDLATAESAPKPTEFATAAGRAMSYGFVGLLSTIVPILLGAIALGRQLPLLPKRAPVGTAK